MKVPSEADRSVGMEVYASGTEPCRARLRSSPEDFQVQEVMSGIEVAADWRPGLYPLYRVEKSLIDTMHMEKEISDALGSRVRVGGLKDKRAKAVQYVTPTSSRARRPERVETARFSAVIVGYVPRPLSSGSVHANRFVLVLRECGPGIGDVAEKCLGLAQERRVPNFFGLQRFGTAGAGTHRIGRAIVRREFREAVRLILCEPRHNDSEAAKAARDAIAGGDYKAGLKMLPRNQDVERGVAASLVRHEDDWVRALRSVHVRLRRFYVHAYQSFIFNRTLSLAVEEGEDISSFKEGDNWCETTPDGLGTKRVRGVRDEAPAGAIPLVQIPGFAWRDYGSRFDSYASRVMRDDGLEGRQFYVEEVQEVSAEGGFRRPHLPVSEAKVSVDGDSATLGFTLGRGSYATVLLREIVKPEDPDEAGFV